MKVLMVCLGNICRSPLAEGILKSKVNDAQVHVDSAGTGGYHLGNAPDPRSIEVARKHGLDISSQVCRKFNVLDFDEFDIIYAMDKSNYANIIDLARNKIDAQKVKLLLNELNSAHKEVPDPYYNSEEGFENVFQMIDQACDVIAARLENK
ncbi:low molecular weight protein-tyrosine-phosphatase [Maribacter hydrothermalis]|uniref:protein-tyrosine-phosphatase n=1 Tax=Maribacter hydrothermalis TaxID=1836467 RepID=A0A1B7Z7Y3_9FLAO|nr:low molecular weight protein-tyrosine-phosphatase [Maribacter hydrothermalis]APQ15819.1 protein-tyrosine-phosphatase [Maribacter hydrothermalis]OBR38802.1 protein-tyrosine-phosphatase [Maribacter hydrothermalis]